MPIQFSSAVAALITLPLAAAMPVRAQEAPAAARPPAPVSAAGATPPVAGAVPKETPAPLLSIGSDAPPLTVGEWVKGQPVLLAPGKITVIDFWATWCGPCRPALARSSALAKKYAGKVQFAGISVREQMRPAPPAAIDARIKAFATEMGDRADIPLASDTADKKIENTWVLPSGEDEFPLAYIVDRDGKIAWMGNPMFGMEEALVKIVAGTYNREMAIQAQATEREYAARQKMLNEKMDTLYGPALGLANARKFKEAVSEMDKVTAANPDFADHVAYLRYNLLFAYDQEAAQKFAGEMATTAWRNEALILDKVAWSIVAPGSPVKKPDYPLAVRLAEAAVALSGEGEPAYLETLAVAYDRRGDLARAIETGEKAVAQFAKEDVSDMAKAIRARVAAMKAKRDGAAKRPK